MMQGTAVALAHARGRLPENLRQEFDNMINAPQQSPENIKAVLSHIQPWLEKAGSMSEQPMNPPNVKPRANAAVSQTSGHKIGDSIVQNGRTFKVVSVDKDGKVTGAE
jgi:hypothetical protein